MRHILFCFTLIFLFTACSNDKKPAATIQKPKTEKNTKPANKKGNKKGKQTPKKVVKSKDKNPYFAGLQEALGLSNAELKEFKAAQNKYFKLRAKLPKNDTAALDNWRKKRNEEYMEILGMKKYRQKAAYDRRLRKNKK